MQLLLIGRSTRDALIESLGPADDATVVVAMSDIHTFQEQLDALAGRLATVEQQVRVLVRLPTTARAFEKTTVDAANPSEPLGHDVWSRALAIIATMINRYSFSTWFKGTRLLEDTASGLSVEVADQMVAHWFRAHYGDVIAEALAEVGRPGAQVTFVVGGRNALEPIDPLE